MMIEQSRSVLAVGFTNRWRHASARWFAAAGLILTTACGLASAADPPKLAYRHDHLNIYPASAVAPAIKIDGDLSDWKPEAFVRMCADPDLLDVYSLRIAMAYDDRGLLIAADFTDTTPLMNAHDPAIEPAVGWAGDALQVRFVTDPAAANPMPEKDTYTNDRIVHLTMWYYTAKGEPAIDVRYGMDYHGQVTLIGGKSGLAFKKTEKGYALEGRIPWSVLHTEAPRPGQKWIATLQPLWGSGGAREQQSFFDVIGTAGFPFQSVAGWGEGYFVKSDEVAAKLAEQNTQEARLFAVAEKSKEVIIPVRYTNPAKGFVSLAICKPGGQIVRTLLAKAEHPAGEQTENWDGRDDDGKPMPPGKYQLKALTHPGIKPRFVMSLMNSGNPPWGTSLPHNGWGGDHGNPIAATSDANGSTYLLWSFSEGGSTVLCVDKTGQKQWGTALPWGELGSYYTTAVYDDGKLYIAKDGPQHRFGAGDPDTINGGLMVYDATTGRRLNFPGNKATITVSDWNKTLLKNAVAPGSPSEKMRGGKFTIAESGLDANLVALAASPDYIYCSLYLENKIVALDKKTFAISRTYNVPKPAGIVYDSQRKLLYALSGDRSIIAIDAGGNGQIKSVVSEGIEYPTGLTIDKQGNLYAAVRGKQMRVLVFDPAGKPINQIGKAGGRPWVGKYDPKGMLMPAGIAVDADNRLWVTEFDASPKRISLWDCSNGKLIREFFGSAAYSPGIFAALDKPEEVYIHNCRFIVDYAKGAWKLDATVWRADYEDGTMPGIPDGVFTSYALSVTPYKGKRFASDGSTIYVDKGDRFEPAYVVCHGGPVFTQYGMGDPASNVGYEWVDANGDGKITPDEVHKAPLDLSNGHRCAFGQAMMPGMVHVRGAGYSLQKKLFRPDGLSATGVPIYPHPEDAPWLFRSYGEMAGYDRLEDIWPVSGTNEEQWYAIAATTNGGSGPIGDGIFRCDRDGHILWKYSRVKIDFGLGAPLARPGDLYGALDIVGTAQFPARNGGEVVGIGVYRGYFGFMNEDGLFIDQVGYDNGRSPVPSFDTYFIENFSGYFFRHPKTGKCYLLAGDVDGRILELQGFENIRRFSAGSLTVSEAQFQQVASGSTKIVADRPQMLSVAVGKEPKRFTKITLDESRVAEVGLSYDPDNLYATFKVPDVTPWQNGAKDWRFLFKGGDAVDIQLGINDATDAKRKPQTGDVRVLIGPGEKPGEFTAVAMWLSVPVGMSKEPQRYQSPTGEEVFPRVVRLTSVQCSLEPSAAGYVLKAAIPWKELGLTSPIPGAGTFFQGDVGVLQSDGSGTQTILRRYLFNQDTAIVNDVPTEVRVNIHGWRKIYFE